MISTLVFYLFSTVLVASALMVISSKNPVHSVLFLILAFFNAAGLFVMLGAEFVAMILVIVYVGAVAVLFLFVVMMLDISFADLRKGAMQYVPLGLILAAVLLFELGSMYAAWQFAPDAFSNAAHPEPSVTNTEALGRILYTDYALPFQISGLILLVAMVGAITLTLRRRPDVKRQIISVQVSRKISDVVENVKVESGRGIE